MVEWLAELKGGSIDLRRLASELTAPELNVVSEDGAYYLKSTDFAALDDSNAVYKRAEEIVGDVNEAARCLLPDFGAVTLEALVRVEQDGRRSRTVFGSAHLSARFRLAVSSDPSQPSRLPAVVAAKRANRHVADALRYFDTFGRAEDQASKWSNLHNVLEVIRDDLGHGDQGGGGAKVVANGWATAVELRRIGGTANNPRAIGDAARHAFPDPKRPVPSSWMSLAEAEDLIRRLLTTWLRTRGA